MTTGSKRKAACSIPSAWTLAVLLATTLIAASPASAQTMSVIHNFTNQGDGGSPFAGLTVDRAGNFYGVTTSGGGGYGTVFRLKRSGTGWVLSTLYNFQASDGGAPTGGVVVGADGSLYGMNTYGGTGCAPLGCGSVYRLRPPASFCHAFSCPWTKTTIYAFQGYPDGGYPEFGSLIVDAAGNLYGAASGEGTHLAGTVFKLTPSGGAWTESVLWNFTGGADGGGPFSNLIFDGAGNLYGTTIAGGNGNNGTVFKLSPSGSGWTQQTLYAFTGANDGSVPYGGVAMDRLGNLFGGTEQGGSPGNGTAFALTPSGGGLAYNLLQTFSGYDGPFASPTIDAAGNVFLTSAFSTIGSGANAGGVYELSPTNGTWSVRTLYAFSGGTDGNIPAGSVVVAPDGTVYGTTVAGGAFGAGVIFQITP